MKRDAMEESFRKHLAPQGITWVKPEGGFFYWLNTGNIDSGDDFSAYPRQIYNFILIKRLYRSIIPKGTPSILLASEPTS